jgi:hypothetical protein
MAWAGRFLGTHARTRLARRQRMPLYRLHDLGLRIEPEDLEVRTGLHALCVSLGWKPARGQPRAGLRAMTLRLSGHGATVPGSATRQSYTNGFQIFEDGAGTFVSDGASTLHVRPDASEAEAWLDGSFHQIPRPVQAQFWSFAILKLLRPAGYFSLHAAAVISPRGTGMLIVGRSGSGKSTLAIGLIRGGWGYLSDDAVLLYRRRETVCAALRTSFYIDADVATSYGDMRLGNEIADATGGRRRRVHVDDRYAHRRAPETVPHVLLFPAIVEAERSTIVRLEPASALRQLLAESGPQLFDRRHMDAHLTTLGDLLRQSAAYRLNAGRDLHRRPDRVLDLIPCEGRW